MFPKFYCAELPFVNYTFKGCFTVLFTPPFIPASPESLGGGSVAVPFPGLCRLALYNCLLCCVGRVTSALFPGVNEWRRERLPVAPPARPRGPSGPARLTPPCTRLIPQTPLLFEVLGWVPAPLPPGRKSLATRLTLWQPSVYVSSLVFAYRTNRKVCSFVCKCVCPQGWGFELKVFTVPLIPNYTQAPTWASPYRQGESCPAVGSHLAPANAV